MSDLVYSTMHLHIRDGVLENCSRPADVLNHPLTIEESLEFYQQGYFILEDAVEMKVIIDCRKYIDSQYHKWIKMTKRQDDWRCHFCLDFDTFPTLVENVPILNLLLKSPKIIGRIQYLTGRMSGIFYTQVAFRTPLPNSMRDSTINIDEYLPGQEYHIDGQANASGDRFPDHWTLLIGIALVDILTTDKGNFTVFPGSHTSRSWASYPFEKKTRTLPNLENPTKICLKAGDCVIVHVLVAHRGGKNILELTAERDGIVSNIQPNTREMVFIRVQCEGIDYRSPERSAMVLQDPWHEHKVFITNYFT